MMITVATVQDTEALVQLSEQLGYSITPEQLRSNLQHLINSDSDVVFVANLDGNIQGWIHVTEVIRVESGPFAEIGGLVVDENARGQGIGSDLVEAAISWSTARGLGKIRVRSNVVREDSIRFYINRGFELSKEQAVLDRLF